MCNSHAWFSESSTIPPTIINIIMTTTQLAGVLGHSADSADNGASHCLHLAVLLECLDVWSCWPAPLMTGPASRSCQHQDGFCVLVSYRLCRLHSSGMVQMMLEVQPPSWCPGHQRLGDCTQSWCPTREWDAAAWVATQAAFHTLLRVFMSWTLSADSRMVPSTPVLGQRVHHLAAASLHSFESVHGTRCCFSKSIDFRQIWSCLSFGTLAPQSSLFVLPDFMHTPSMPATGNLHVGVFSCVSSLLLELEWPFGWPKFDVVIRRLCLDFQRHTG